MLPKIVIIRGAVSPPTLATANSTPVIIPDFAAGITTLNVVLHLLTPRAKEASLTELGTSFSDSSVVLATTGIKIKARAIAPAIAEYRPIMMATTTPATVIPTTIDGNSVSISLIDLIALAYLLLPYSERYTPDNIPMGIPIRLVSPIRMNEP